ncbi:cytochrome P450 CYP4/CYP19/CYP26 subfamily protein [Poronia punctata]|nr:cytochrome P450 CYP4/CYP19/CYP26 subfamily protein [Poronia punctata]
MSASTTLLLIIITILTLWSIKTWHRLRHIPGPFWASITNLQRVWWVQTGKAHLYHRELHEVYGDVVRLGPNMVSVRDPEVIPVVYPMRTGFIKSDFYAALRAYTPHQGTMLAVFNTQDEDMHKRIKNPIAPLFAFSRIVQFEETVDGVLECLKSQFDEMTMAGKEIDLGDWLQFFAFDVMGTLTFSKRYGFLDQGRDVDGRILAIFRYMKAAAPMTQIPWLDKCINKNRIAHTFRRTPGMSIMGFVGKVVGARSKDVEERRGSKDKDKESRRKDFLDHYLEIREGNPEIPTWAPLAWVFSNVLAGSDSVGTVMRTVMYNLLLHQTSLEKLRQELLDANVSEPYPQWSEVGGLPYLDACIQEGLRLYPPFALPFERIVPAGGITIQGKYIPEGTIVGASPYVVNRYTPVFGEDAEIWRPERWLEGDRKVLDRSLLTFGAGKRVCLGKHIGILELKKLVSFLVMEYDLKLVDPNRFTVENAWVLKQRGLDVRVTKRRGEDIGVKST